MKRIKYGADISFRECSLACIERKPAGDLAVIAHIKLTVYRHACVWHALLREAGAGTGLKVAEGDVYFRDVEARIGREDGLHKIVSYLHREHAEGRTQSRNIGNNDFGNTKLHGEFLRM